MSAQVLTALDPKVALLRGIWMDCLRGVLSQLAGSAVSVEPEAEDESAPGVAADAKSEVWSSFTTSKALHGQMAILLTEAGALRLAQLLMSEPPNLAVPFDAARREAYEELMRQVVGQVATGLKSAAKGDVEIKLSGSAAPADRSGIRAGIRITEEKLAPVRLLLVVSTEPAESFPADPAEKTAAAPPGPGNVSPQTELSVAQNANLELLLDVTLDATICFGRKEMLLRDILELHPGAAVVLDRHVEEPVDLLVGGRMVARGEVVIVDGNYGLRITEILSAQQRVASLLK